MKELLIFIAGVAVGVWVNNAEAQTYVVTTLQGHVAGYIQQNGSTINVLGPNGNLVSPPLTAYPNQIVAPSGMAVGIPSYTVPMQPPSPPQVRVLQ